MKKFLVFSLCLIHLQTKTKYEVIQTIPTESKYYTTSLAMTDDSQVIAYATYRP